MFLQPNSNFHLNSIHSGNDLCGKDKIHEFQTVNVHNTHIERAARRSEKPVMFKCVLLC